MSRTRSFLAIAVLAAAAAASAFVSATVDTAASVVGVIHRAWDFMENALTPTFKIKPQPVAQDKPRLQLVAAKSFALRLLKFERPNVTTSWRMCPSI